MNKKRVLLGLSGGVDSAVSLILLLKNKNYEVDCLFMRNWDSFVNGEDNLEKDNNLDICPQERDYNDCIDICKKFNVKLIRKDFIKEYWDKVFTYFIEELNQKRTPNPDVLCNNEIKFKAFLNYALSLGYDYIATGHYAKLDKNKNLLIPKDKTKDQTYFLAELEKEKLKKVIFPLANIKKTTVRKIAKKYNLINKDKKDSTGICFIGERNFTNFLKNYIKSENGPIKFLGEDKVIGTHDGLSFYTIGQRKNLNINQTKDVKGPFFVASKDLDNNTLYVVDENESIYLYSNKCTLIKSYFRFNLNKPLKVNIRFRHLQKFKKGLIKLENNKIILEYENSKSVTPGQLAAVYKKNICLGAGFIDAVYFNEIKRSY